MYARFARRGGTGSPGRIVDFTASEFSSSVRPLIRVFDAVVCRR